MNDTAAIYWLIAGIACAFGGGLLIGLCLAYGKGWDDALKDDAEYEDRLDAAVARHPSGRHAMTSTLMPDDISRVYEAMLSEPCETPGCELTDSQYTAKMASDMDAWIERNIRGNV
jgi:hypothetical protein